MNRIIRIRCQKRGDERVYTFYEKDGTVMVPVQTLTVHKDDRSAARDFAVQHDNARKAAIAP